MPLQLVVLLELLALQLLELPLGLLLLLQLVPLQQVLQLLLVPPLEQLLPLVFPQEQLLPLVLILWIYYQLVPKPIIFEVLKTQLLFRSNMQLPLFYFC